MIHFLLPPAYEAARTIFRCALILVACNAMPRAVPFARFVVRASVIVFAACVVCVALGIGDWLP